MKQVLALDASKFSTDDIALYATTFCGLFNLSNGNSSRFSKSLTVKPSDGLKVWLGIPAEEMTREHIMLFNAIYSYTFNTAMPTDTAWTSFPNWQPKNHKSSGHAKNKALDLEFMEYLGLPFKVWREEIMYSSLKEPHPKDEFKHMHYFAALAHFGFPDPHQFFI